MRIVSTKCGKNLHPKITNEFDIKALTAYDDVRRDIENGFGFVLRPDFEEREDLLELFKYLQKYTIKNILQILKNHNDN